VAANQGCAVATTDTRTERSMAVRRTESGYQTTFALLDGDRGHRWTLAYGEVELAPAVWKLVEHNDGSVGVIATIHPRALPLCKLEDWLAATIDAPAARELADAVRAQPPRHLAGAATPTRSDEQRR
jgi:hypothetical protein